MLSTQEKKDKDQFFQDLYRLDHLDDNDDDDVIETECPTKTPKHSARPPVKKSVQPDPAYKGVTENQLQRKRRSCEQDTKPATTTSDSRKRHSSLDRAPSKEKDEKRTGSRENVTDLSNLKLRKQQLKGRLKLKPVPLDQQMFRGCVFFFVPNSDDCPRRRFQIHKAIHFGGVWANQWSDDVSHIIVCDGLNATVAAKSFPFGEIPKDRVFVRDNWLVDSFAFKAPRETHWGRFQVPGSEQSKEAKKQSVPTGEGRAVDSRDRNPVRVPITQTKKGDITPSKLDTFDEGDLADESTDSEDELDHAMRDVWNLGNLPVAPSFDGTSLSSEQTDRDPALEVLLNNDKIRKENAGFQCMEKNDGRGNKSNPNARTIEMLQKLASYYDRKGDHWRTTAYRKAINSLRRQSQLIRTKQQALALSQVGESIAANIEEFVATDRVARLEYAQKDPDDRTLELFMGIYDVGFHTASRLLAQGHRTLEDLRQNAELTPNQRVGLEHYQDFQQRIPRGEVAQHAAIVQRALTGADKTLRLIVGGSYRRGKADCGDIDCIITKENADIGHIRTLMMDVVIPKLTAQGFLKVALASGRTRASCSKWHGASAMPGSQIWRRIDLLFVPWAELGASLIYFTGNDLFNRSMRLLASRKQMRLNQHGLYADVLRGRGRERVTDGRLLEGHDERRIFEILGVPYRPPGDRQIG